MGASGGELLVSLLERLLRTALVLPGSREALGRYGLTNSLLVPRVRTGALTGRVALGDGLAENTSIHTCGAVDISSVA